MENRFTGGFVWGIMATIAMSVVMLIGVATGLSPMPKPIPMAIVSTILGEGTPQPLLMIAAITAHLTYGGIWGGAFASGVRPVTVWKGLGLGVFLWLIMQLFVLPLLGWGLFGSAVTPAIAMVTLLLHVVYGATYGALMDRRAIAVAH